MDEASFTEWLSLAGAAKFLGVHPSTVRVWSDKGLLPVYRTKGGHRRYKRSEVELWAKHANHQMDVPPEAMMQSAIGNVRMRIGEGDLEVEPWYQKLDEEARQQYRRSAHMLFQGLMSYLVSKEEGASNDAHAIGYEYASRAHRYNLNITEATEAFIFFRKVLLDSIIQVYEEANIPSGQAWGTLGRVHEFTDQVLLNLVDTFRKLQPADK